MFSSYRYLSFCIGLLIFKLQPSFSLHWSSCFQAMTNFHKFWSSSQIAPFFFRVVFMFSSYNHPPLIISVVVGVVTSHPLPHVLEKMSANYLDQTFHLIKMSNVFVKWVHMVPITNRHLCYHIYSIAKSTLIIKIDFVEVIQVILNNVSNHTHNQMLERSLLSLSVYIVSCASTHLWNPLFGSIYSLWLLFAFVVFYN